MMQHEQDARHRRTHSPQPTAGRDCSERRCPGSRRQPERRHHMLQLTTILASGCFQFPFLLQLQSDWTAIKVQTKLPIFEKTHLCGRHETRRVDRFKLRRDVEPLTLVAIVTADSSRSIRRPPSSFSRSSLRTSNAGTSLRFCSPPPETSVNIDLGMY